MGLMDRINGLWPAPSQEVERSTPLSMSFDQWANDISSFSFNGMSYTLPGAKQEDIGSSYSGLARGAFKGNSVVFACIANRLDLFAEARFAYRRTRSGRPGDLFSFKDDDLEILRRPWVGGTTGDLLARMLLHVDVAGNSYVARRGGMLTPLRPDWVSIIGGLPKDAEATVWHPEARVLGYAYQEGGPALGKEPMFFMADEVAHFAPRPDPETRFVGMSWLTPIVRQIMADKAMDAHKLAFFENGATPNLAVTLNVDSLEKFREWVKELEGNHTGVANAYRTLFMASGASAEVLGVDMQQLDFKIVQGAGETRIAAAAGVPPVIVGLSEGLAAATYSNYSQARRRFADQTIRPLWRNAAGSLAQIIRVPSDAELWYDDRDITALQDDQKERAEINQTDAVSVQTLVNAGFEPKSVIAAIGARDMTLLSHTGLLSVQLQDPTAAPPEPSAPALPAADPPKRELDPFDLLANHLHQMRQEPRQLEPPMHFHIGQPDVHVDVASPSITVEQPQITVEPTRFDEGAIQVNVEAAKAPDVSVNVEPAQVVIEKSKARRVDFGDGRSATVTEGETKHVKYDDGREVTITEVDQ